MATSKPGQVWTFIDLRRYWDITDEKMREILNSGELKFLDFDLDGTATRKQNFIRIRDADRLAFEKKIEKN